MGDYSTSRTTWNIWSNFLLAKISVHKKYIGKSDKNLRVISFTSKKLQSNLAWWSILVVGFEYSDPKYIKNTPGWKKFQRC